MRGVIGVPLTLLVGAFQLKVAVPLAAASTTVTVAFLEVFAPLELKHVRMKVVVAVKPLVVLLPSTGSLPSQGP